MKASLSNYPSKSANTKQFPKCYYIVYVISFILCVFLIYKYISLKNLNQIYNAEYFKISNESEYTKNQSVLIQTDYNGLKRRIEGNRVLLKKVDSQLNRAKDLNGYYQDTLNKAKKVLSAIESNNFEDLLNQSKKELNEQLNSLEKIEDEIYANSSLYTSQIIINDQIKVLESITNKKIGRACYLSDIDGFSAVQFHKRCDKKGPTITLYQSSLSKFAGYTSVSWESSGDPLNYDDNNSFLFSLDYNKQFFPVSTKNIIVCCNEYFPSFGPKDLLISEKNAGSEFPSAYGSQEDKKYKLIDTRKTFDILKIEVYLSD